MRPYRGPHPGQMFEITTRSINRQMLLRPSKQVNEIILGVIGRAQQNTDVKIYALVFMSTHYHLLVSVKSAKEKSDFIGFINGNISKKLNSLNDRNGSSWQRRFRAIGVAPDRCTQERRLRYLLSHGVKERLVQRARDWPGASSLPWLVHGKPLRGVWTSFTSRYYAKRRKDYIQESGEFQTVYIVKMTVLPCWSQLAPDTWRGLVCAMVRQIEADANAARITKGVGVLGVDAILATEPDTRLQWQSQTRAPSVHASCKSVRAALRSNLRLRRTAYAEASARFRAGQWDVEFPHGMFRPGGGFVPHLDVEFATDV